MRPFLCAGVAGLVLHLVLASEEEGRVGDPIREEAAPDRPTLAIAVGVMDEPSTDESDDPEDVEAIGSDEEGDAEAEWEEPAAKPGTGSSWRLEIVDRFDAGIPGATVVLRFRRESPAGQGFPACLGVTRRATDVQGTVEVVPPDDAAWVVIELLLGERWFPVPRTRWSKKGGWRVADARDTEIVPESRQLEPRWRPLRWRIWERGIVAGRVLSEDGSPAPSARVEAWWPRFPVASPEPVVASGDGRFAMLVPLGEAVDLTAWSALDERTRPRHTASLHGVLAGSRLVVLRMSSIPIRCLAVDGRGEPADRAAGWVDLLDLSGHAVDWHADPRCTPEFSVVAPCSGRYRLRYRRVDGSGWGCCGPFFETVEQEVEAPGDPVRIVVDSQRSVEGRIAGGRAEAMGVAWRGCDGVWLRGSTPASDGAFKVYGVVGEEGDLHVSASGDDRYALLRGVRTGRGPVEVTLQTGLRIEGQWAGAGSPETLRIEAEGGDVRRRAVVEASGRFRVCGLPPGRYRLSVECAGERWTIDDVAGGATDLRVAPPP
jgi:hypothetical protein